jgi:endo-1,4-beta-xylanase
VSELVITVNTAKSSSFVPDAATFASQAALYKYVVQSYLKNVPAAQRFGITTWGLTDSESWLNTPSAPDFPLLFDKNMAKKPAYTSYIQALKGL